MIVYRRLLITFLADIQFLDAYLWFLKFPFLILEWSKKHWFIKIKISREHQEGALCSTGLSFTWDLEEIFWNKSFITIRDFFDTAYNFNMIYEVAIFSIQDL